MWNKSAKAVQNFLCWITGKQLSSEEKTGNHNFPYFACEKQKKYGTRYCRRNKKKELGDLHSKDTNLKTKYSGLRLFSQRYDLPLSYRKCLLTTLTYTGIFSTLVILWPTENRNRKWKKEVSHFVLLVQCPRGQIVKAGFWTGWFPLSRNEIITTQRKGCLQNFRTRGHIIWPPLHHEGCRGQTAAPLPHNPAERGGRVGSPEWSGRLDPWGGWPQRSCDSGSGGPASWYSSRSMPAPATNCSNC